MNKIQKSGLYNTNTFAHVTLKAIEEIVGKNGLAAILKHAGLDELINSFPPKNREKAFDFSYYSAINHAIRDIYGERGSRVLLLRAGRATFDELLKSYNAMLGAADLAMKLVPLKVKLSLGLNAVAKVFNSVSDQQTSVEDNESEFIYSVHNCPACWGFEGVDSPICFMQVGLIKEGLKWLSNGKEFDVYENTCHAMGAEACTFVIHKEPIGE